MQKNEAAESFDAALLRQSAARRMQDETADREALPAADPAADPAAMPAPERRADARDTADQGEALSAALQDLIASLTLLSPPRSSEPAQPARLLAETGASASMVTDAIAANTVTADTVAADAIAEEAIAGDRLQARPALHRHTPTAAENQSASLPVAAADGHAASGPFASSQLTATQSGPTPAMLAAPPAVPFTLQEQAAAPTLHLAPRPGNAGWDQALGQRMVWLAGSGHQQASLTINPPQLGPVQVTLQIQDNQAIASFVSAQPEVRQALEAAIPKLRELMHEAGLQLSHAQVQAGGPDDHGANARSRQQSAPSPGASHSGSTGLDGAGANDTAQSLPLTAGSGLVDTFA